MASSIKWESKMMAR